MSYNKQFFMENLIHPGITLQELLDSIEMKQKELAIRVGVTSKHINGIINGKDSISPDIALKFEKVLGIPAGFWNNLQKSYDEDRVRLEEQELLKNEESEVSKYTCYKELVKLKLVDDTRVKGNRLLSLLKFFSISSFSMLPNLEEMAFRKYKNKSFSKENFISWLRVGDIIGNKIEVADFSKQKLKSIIPELKEFTKKESIDIKGLESIFAKVGVRFVFVKGFENNSVIGLTKKFKGKPLIQISDRWKKTDIFWFTLFHEIGHILLHLSNEDSIFIDYDKNNINKIETEADNFAQSTLIDKEIYESELSKEEISVERIARLLNIGKSIVAGRIGHDYTDSKSIWSLVSRYRSKLEVFNSQL